MINSIKQAIVNKLSELYPTYTIYDEDLPQDFLKPSFLITLTDQNYNKRLNTKYKSCFSFNVSYFSNMGLTEIKEDCLGVQVNLLRGFDIIGNYRIQNKKAQIIDNVLHFTFNINYSEIKVTQEVLMQQMTTNTNF